MIEIGGVSRNRRRSNSENSTILGFNVDDVSAAAEWLAKRGVTVRLARGEVGTFLDPDGNVCELKDAGDPFIAH